MAVTIQAYHPDLLPDLTRLINAHLCLVPPYWTFDDAQVAYLLANVQMLWALHYDDETPAADAPVVCGFENDRLTAAVQVGVFKRDDGEKDHYIKWLVCEPERPHVLNTLLEHVIESSSALDCHAIYVFRNALGVGWFGIPACWSHLVNGLERVGFEVFDRWLIMTANTDVSISMPPLVRFDWDINESRLEWTVKAIVGDSVVGDSDAWGIPPHFKDCDGYSEWMTIEWLGVEVPFQRRGIGKALLQTQLDYHRKRGVSKVIVWTETDNQAAQGLNLALGFTYGPECWSFRKLLV